MKRTPTIEAVKPIVREAPDAGDSLTAFEEIAKDAEKLAPAMREIVRDEKSGEKALVADVLQTDKDACVRLAFAASTELRAILEDQSGIVLAETKAKSGAVGDRGPVCVRKGGTIRARFEGDGPLRVRFITWTSP